MQIDAVVLSTVVALLAVALAIYTLVKVQRTGGAITAETVTGILNDATGQARELADVALTAAGAAEQLWRTGEIERSERFSTAFRYVQKWFPALDEETIVTALEAAVLTINSVVASLPTKK